jgi:hypothetical protein
VARVADGRRRKTLAIFAITARQFFGKMHGIAHGATVAATVYPVTVCESRHKQLCSIGDFLDIGVVAHKCGQHLLAGCKCGVNMLFQKST